MFANQQWIKNEYTKMKNPANLGNNKYEGLFNEAYDFKYQAKNFNIIKKLLEPYNIYPKEIYSSEIEEKPTFIVTWSDPNLFWKNNVRTTKCMNCLNHIYYKDKKMNTSSWIKLKEDEIKDFLT